MTLTPVITRNGAPIVWRPMAGNAGAYNPATGAVEGATTSSTTIYGVLDGFGSVESQLKASNFEGKSLLTTGALRVFTTAAVKIGDLLTIDGQDYTISYVKSIWKKKVAVLYEAWVKL